MLRARDEEKLSEKVGSLLYRLREAQNLSQRAAAKIIGVSQARLASLEQGRDLHTGRPTLPSAELTARIASAYRYPKERLMLLAGHVPWLLDIDDADALVTFATRLPDQG